MRFRLRIENWNKAQGGASASPPLVLAAFARRKSARSPHFSGIKGLATANPQITKETTMRYGARNQIPAKVTSVKKGDVMTQVNFSVEVPHAMSSVLTTESVEDLALAPGDTVLLVVKAIHVVPVKE